jgi:hypothetical protein
MTDSACGRTTARLIHKEIISPEATAYVANQLRPTPSPSFTADGAAVRLQDCYGQHMQNICGKEVLTTSWMDISEMASKVWLCLKCHTALVSRGDINNWTNKRIDLREGQTEVWRSICSSAKVSSRDLVSMITSSGLCDGSRRPPTGIWVNYGTYSSLAYVKDTLIITYCDSNPNGLSV